MGFTATSKDAKPPDTVQKDAINFNNFPKSCCSLAEDPPNPDGTYICCPLSGILRAS